MAPSSCELAVYVLCNPIAADLVDRVQDWPGISSLAYLGDKETSHRRPNFFFRNDGTMPEIAKLTTYVPPRITESESRASWWKRVREAVRKREEVIRDARFAQKRRVMGRKAVLRMPHTATPKNPELHRSLRPAIACKDAERRRLELKALKDFRARYARARKQWSSGQRRVTFPLGTYRMLDFGVRCTTAPPPELSRSA